MKIRLDKYLTDLGYGTRSQVKKIILSGQVSIEEKIVKKADTKIDIEKERVYIEGKQLEYCRFEHYILNKPTGYITATEDVKYKTVMDLLNVSRKGLAPVGRLDKDTEGLLFITNDGALAHKLLSPKYQIGKTYYAIIRGNLPQDAKIQFKNGIWIDRETITKPSELSIIEVDTMIDKYSGMEINGSYFYLKNIENKELSHILLTIYEGKYHQVKRMFQKLGCEVIYLKRIAMGEFRLDERKLKTGEYQRII